MFSPVNTQVRLEENLLQIEEDLGLAALPRLSNHLNIVLSLLWIFGDNQAKPKLSDLFDGFQSFLLI